MLQYSMCVCNGYKYHTEAWNSLRSISLITGTGSNMYVQMARHGMSTNVSVVVNDYDGSSLCTCNVVCLFCCCLFVCIGCCSHKLPGRAHCVPPTAIRQVCDWWTTGEWEGVGSGRFESRVWCVSVSACMCTYVACLSLCVCACVCVCVCVCGKYCRILGCVGGIVKELCV